MKRALDSIFGSMQHFTFENRVFNAIIFVTVFQCVTAAIYNISIGMPANLSLIIIFIGILCSLFYYFARFKKRFNALSFVLLSSILLSIVWFLNEGSRGATPFLFITSAAGIISISKKKWHLPYLSILVLTIATLLFLEANYSEFLMHGHHSEAEKQSDIVFFFIFNLVLIYFIVSFLKKNYDDESKIIQEQKEVLNIQKERIISSIKSAEFIQDALLPNESYIKTLLPEFFIVFKPKDIVSGDFYWIHPSENDIKIAAADCTGHGVSGALMSMLGVALLNEIVGGNHNLHASQILDTLREQIKKILNQPGRVMDLSYGMDISLCSLNIKERTMQFAGAYNSLYLIRNNDFIEYKADRMPIGLYPKEKPFTNHQFSTEPNDVFYICSDGFEDQQGTGSKGKFLKKNLKKLLLEIHQESMAKQKEIFENTFAIWKGKEEQTEDILIIGLKMVY